MKDHTDPAEQVVPTNDPNIEVVVRPTGPRFPFFKDERVFGGHGPKTASSIRFLIIAVLVATIIFGAAIWGILALINQVESDMAIGRADRQAAQAAQQAEIADLNHVLAKARKAIQTNEKGTRDLACSVVNYANTQGGSKTKDGRRFIRFLSKRYQCKGYHPVKHPVPLPVPTVPAPSAIPSYHSIAPGSGSSTAVAASAPPARSGGGHSNGGGNPSGRHPQPGSGPTHSAPSPSPRPTPAPSTPRPSPSPSPSPSPPPPVIPLPSPVKTLVCGVVNPLIGLCKS